jgi:hypothetical protein
MTGKLRKVSYSTPELGMYTASGTLEGVTPGRRKVKRLEVRRLDGSSVDGLRPLTGFADLEVLELERLEGVDLAPLAELPVGLSRLLLGDLRSVDLAPLEQLHDVESLLLTQVHDDCRIPDELRLPSSLRSLLIVNDKRGLTGTPVKRLIEAIDWQRLGDLRVLNLQVGGNEALAPIEVDLGLLRHMPKLERLDIHTNVWHAGPAPSPLDPPFEGLSRDLTWLRIDAWEPGPLKTQLRELLGSQVAVYQRYGHESQAASWTIRAPGDGLEVWHTYGCLVDVFDDKDFATEYDALKHARKQIRDANPALLRRLDFDHESSGTGIATGSEEDLVAALEILGVDRGNQG